MRNYTWFIPKNSECNILPNLWERSYDDVICFLAQQMKCLWSSADFLCASYPTISSRNVTFLVALVPGWRGGVFQRPWSHRPWSGSHRCPDPNHPTRASCGHLHTSGKKPESAGVCVCMCVCVCWGGGGTVANAWDSTLHQLDHAVVQMWLWLEYEVLTMCISCCSCWLLQWGAKQLHSGKHR